MSAALVVRGQTYPEDTDACCLPDAWSDIGKIPTGGDAVGRIAFDVPKAGLDAAVLFLRVTDSETFDEAEGVLRCQLNPLSRGSARGQGVGEGVAP
jgi:hypothetical protein